MHMDFMGWPLGHGVPKEKMSEELTSVLLELYIRETKCSHSQKDFRLEKEEPQPSLYIYQAWRQEGRICQCMGPGLSHT